MPALTGPVAPLPGTQIHKTILVSFLRTGLLPAGLTLAAAG
jgi:hypothetical protein